MSKIKIIGAGMAGLLAGNMLRRHEVQILEKQSSLPNNHHAVLRFRNRRVSEQTHIPFREVRVFKACDEPDPIKAAMLYSRKVTGRYEVRSLIDLEPCTRYIAPPDFIARMAHGLDIAYGVDGRDYLAPEHRDTPIISTLPMPVLMDLLDYDGARPEFVSHPGWTINVDLDEVDICATRYYSALRFSTRFYRASITGDKLAIEFAGTMPQPMMTQSIVGDIQTVLMDFGIHPEAARDWSVNESRYAKLGNLSDPDRRRAKDFIFWASTKLNIFSLGRFATWRSGLLLDHVVDDVLQIERWIGGTGYDMKKEM